MRWEPRVSRSVAPEDELQVSVGHPLVDEYLQFLTARARPNTRLAVAFDLKVFFSVVDKPATPPLRRPGSISTWPTTGWRPSTAERPPVTECK